MDKLFNGANLGAFRILHQVGEGGMAKVYKAFQPSMERYIALKVLPSHFAEDPQFVERFIREARTIAQLEHRNILPVYDFGEEKGITYLAMRYVEGGTLKELLTQGRITLNDSLDLMSQICAALDYAHRRGVVHRDVKPSNVILDGEGAAYLMDFGIAKVVGVSGDLTATGAAIGTPAYMAPEQAMGETVDGRTDIYALGIMLYEMVVGRVPFQADTPMAVLMAHLRDPLPMPRDMDPSIPESVEAVIIKALAKTPDDRYQTANDLSAALRKAVQAVNARAEAPRTETSTLVTLIQEVQANRPTPRIASDVATDPRLQARLEQDYIDGLSAYWIRNWQKARLCFHNVVAVDPRYKDAADRLAEVEKQLKLVDLYAQAQEAFQKKDWRLAQNLLEQVIQIDTAYQDAPGLLQRANRQLELSGLYAQAQQLSTAEQWQAVLRIFDRLHELDSSYPDPHKLLEKAKNALAEQERLTNLKQTYERGLQAMDTGKWKEALRLFEQVKVEQPGYGATEQLMQRAADELEKTRQGSILSFLRPKRKEPIPEETIPKQEELSATVAVTEDAERTKVSQEAVGEVALETTQEMVSPPSQVAPRRRLPAWVWVGGGLAVIASLVAGLALLWAVFGGLLKPTAVAAPSPTPQEKAAVETQPAAPPLSAEMGTSSIHQHRPDEMLYDDFETPGPDGRGDPERWGLDEQCEAFSAFGRLVQDGVVRLLNYESGEVLRCRMWPGHGERVPGGGIWPFEAKLQYAGEPANGPSTLWLSYLADFDNRHLRTVCGLRTDDTGKIYKVFSSWESTGDQANELAYHEEPVEYKRWFTVQLAINPDNLAFECTIEDELFGEYRYPDGDLVRAVPFAALIETERLPGVVARTLIDDVYLYPREAAAAEPVPPVECPPIIGWRVEYWNNPDLDGPPAVCQNADELSFVWWEGAPAPEIPPDDFSARFSRVVPFYGGPVRFRLGADDGMRLFVDGRPVIDEWFDHGYFEVVAEIELEPGNHELVVEFYDRGEFAEVVLDWSPSQPDLGCLPPPEGVIAWWSGDNPENLTGGPPVELGNTADFGMGKVGPAFIFESRDWRANRAGFVNVPINDEYGNLAQLSLEMWVFLDPGGHPPIERFASFDSEKMVLRKESDGTLHLYMRIGPDLHHIWGPILPRGEWLHIAGTYDGRFLRQYLNGREVGMLEIPGNMARAEGLYFGSDTEALQGRLDEVTLFNRALSAEEIQLIYEANSQGKCK